ncbi:ER membrane protein complex subunit 10-like [Babylonia areolata]|uniref:ER membrane protein complex subunit 10-like n=1 Tax=Babylonia areolata TaxID=304850 RepID=UPI003FD20F6A
MAAPIESMAGKILAGIFFILIAGVHAEDEFEGSRTLQVEHSFDQGASPTFSKRGTVVIYSLKSNKAQFSQASSLSPQEKEQLETAAKQNGIYRLRIPLVKGGSSEPTSFVSTFTTACSVYESGLKDRVMVNFDTTGEVLGVSVLPAVGTCTGASVGAANLTNWKTSVDVLQTVAGPVPDTQTYIDKMKRDEQERAKGQQGDNRSFFGKYWMYIVPFVIMMIIMSSADPQAQGGGGGGR